jgi:deoxyribonuclease-2
MAPRRALILLFYLARGGAPLSCSGPSGEPSDYWFLLKAGGCENASLAECSHYFSFDPERPPADGAAALNATSSLLRASALRATLSALAAARGAPGDGAAVVHWSDDPPVAFLPFRPQTEGSFNAHAKGVLAADAGGGFWLTHSWPKFPDTRAGRPFELIGGASTIYGQSFLCVTLPLEGVEAVARALLAMEPRTYDSAVPAGALAARLPFLAALARGERNASARSPTVANVATPGGRAFRHVSKNGAWGGELYSGAVLPALGLAGAEGALWVETWRRAPAAGSICSAANGSVINVAAVSIAEPRDAAPVAQAFTKDHSKWAVAVCGALRARGNGTGSARGAACSGGAAAPAAFRPWVCVGDINMMTSQAARGGGTVCFDHAPELWGRLAEAVAATDDCAAAAPAPAEPSSPAATRSPAAVGSAVGSGSGSPGGAAHPSAALSAGATPSRSGTPSATPTESGSAAPSASGGAPPAPPSQASAEEAAAITAVATIGGAAALAAAAAAAGAVLFSRRAAAKRLLLFGRARPPSASWRERHRRGVHASVRVLLPAPRAAPLGAVAVENPFSAWGQQGRAGFDVRGAARA